MNNIPQIIFLPDNRWCLEVNDIRSASADYSQRIVATLGRETYAAQTMYYEEEMVWHIDHICPHQTQDESL